MIISRTTTSRVLLLLLVVLTASALADPAAAQGRRGGRGGGAARNDTTGQGGAPSLRALVAASAGESDLRLVTRRFEQDLSNLRARYDVPYSPVRIERERRFFQGWGSAVQSLNAGDLNAAGQSEHALLLNRIEEGLGELDQQEQYAREWAPLLPFARSMQMLQERRRDRLDVDGQQAAQTVEDVRKEVLLLTTAVSDTTGTDHAAALRSITPAIAGRAVEHIGTLRENLESWHTYYTGFDPLFTWWVRTPYAELGEALDAYVRAIQARWRPSVD